jgi:hypothetical protein
MTQPAGDTAVARTLYDRLLGVSREAHGAGLHEVAYHALSAALHAAESAGDRGAVAAIAREAREQIDWIDANAPAHRLSTASAKRHDHPGVYAMLGRQAAMLARLMERSS